MFFLVILFVILLLFLNFLGFFTRLKIIHSLTGYLQGNQRVEDVDPDVTPGSQHHLAWHMPNAVGLEAEGDVQEAAICPVFGEHNRLKLKTMNKPEDLFDSLNNFEGAKQRHFNTSSRSGGLDSSRHKEGLQRHLSKWFHIRSGTMNNHKI